MGKVYISAYEENGESLWGLFYEERGKQKALTENFKPLSFTSEEEAKIRLDAIEEERRSENAAIPFTPEEAKAYAESHRWKFATTYAQTAPHEYLLKKWLDDEEQREFERLVQAIRTYSVVGYFYRHPNNYLILGEQYYWHMFYPDNMAVDLINRSTTDHLEYRDGAYNYLNGASKGKW